MQFYTHLWAWGAARLLIARRGEIPGIALTRPLFQFRGLLVKLNGGTEHLRGTVWIGRIVGPFAPGPGKGAKLSN